MFVKIDKKNMAASGYGSVPPSHNMNWCCEYWWRLMASLGYNDFTTFWHCEAQCHDRLQLPIIPVFNIQQSLHIEILRPSLNVMYFENEFAQEFSVIVAHNTLYLYGTLGRPISIGESEGVDFLLQVIHHYVLIWNITVTSYDWIIGHSNVCSTAYLGKQRIIYLSYAGVFHTLRARNPQSVFMTWCLMKHRKHKQLV